MKLVTSGNQTLDSILLYTCRMLDLWITIQTDDGLCTKPKDVAEVLINTEVELEYYCYCTIHV
jgi:hypothetical protein